MRPVKRPVRVTGDVAFVPLTKGHEAIVDAADAHLVAGHNWTAMESRRKDGTLRLVYGQRSQIVGGVRYTIMLHQVIMPTEPGQIPDHIDGDGLNCRRNNLRRASLSENNWNARTPSHNSSGVKGVTFSNLRKKWMAQIKVRGKTQYLGYYARLEDAASAVARARQDLHGDFARHA